MICGAAGERDELGSALFSPLQCVGSRDQGQGDPSSRGQRDAGIGEGEGGGKDEGT